MITAEELVNQAINLGYDKCGIIPLDALSGYTEKLTKRILRFPETTGRYQKLFQLANPKESFPWAKAVVVCSFYYGKYRIPQNLQGYISRYYLTDSRKNTLTEGYQTSVDFERFLCSQGFQIAFDRDFGIVPLRWAAVEAGLGFFRKNNFFYTEKGSWQHIEAFLIDQPLVYQNTHSLRPCSNACTLCATACPTASLCAPYAMNRNTCISDLTTWSGWDLDKEPLNKMMGDWIYGCDACQDICPYNKHAWTGEKESKSLEMIAPGISLIKLIEAEYSWLEQVLNPLLWYIPKNKCWRYKTNALNAMRNSWRPEYMPAVRRACQDEKAQVRRMARWVSNLVSQE